MSFTTATNGNPLRAADLNQYANAFNGATSAKLAITQTGTAYAWGLSLKLPSGVAAGSSFYTLSVTGDAYPRLSIYYTSGGTLGVALGYGSAPYTGHLESGTTSNSGWTSLQNFTVNGALTSAGGTSSASSLTVSGATQVNGQLTVGGGNGWVDTSSASPAYLYNGSNAPIWYCASGGKLTPLDDGSYIHLTPNVASGNSRNFALQGDNGTGGFVPSIRFEDGGNTFLYGPVVCGNGATFSGISTFSGNIPGSSATISHGMIGHSPTAVIASTGSTGSYAVWTDCGTGAYGSSTYTIYMGASNYNVYALCFTN